MTGDSKLTYKSSNRSVIQMNQAGKATIKGPGRAIITVTAAATANYNAATKQVLITVKPKKTYYVKAQAYKKAGKTDLYGAYSKVRKVKIKQ